MIGLCDCNNFFVSCERVFNPSLVDVPVVVLSSNDGCVIARSNESKTLGIKMGQPLFQIRDLVQQHNVVTLSSNHSLYGDMSRRVMETLKAELPSIEIYSVDEAFLDLSGVDVSILKNYGEKLAAKVKRNTGIPVSIGIAPTKTLAKIASKLCKSYPKLNGSCLLYKEADVAKVLGNFPIGDVWGIGRQSSKMLLSYNITKALQFKQAPREWIKSRMGLPGLRTWMELNGNASILFDNRDVDKKSIMVSRSFSKELYEFDDLHALLSRFVGMAAEKLRRQKSVAGQIQVFVATNRHRTDMPQYNRNEIVSLETPTESTIELAVAATSGLRRIYLKGYGYKKIGVILYDIRPSNGVQPSLFESANHSKHKGLMKQLDAINSYYGSGSVRLGSQSANKTNVSSNYLSPRYTTNWDDIIVVKV